MTKAIKTVAEAVEEANQKAVGVPAPSINEVDNTDYWRRESSLSHAIQFHKNNGGMMNPQQLVDHAHIFLSFLDGASK